MEFDAPREKQVTRHGARSELAFGAGRQQLIIFAMAWKFSCFSGKRCRCS
jgi:hypothetical protein